MTRTLDNCPECGYSLEGLPAEHRCPECGLFYDELSVPHRRVNRGAMGQVSGVMQIRFYSLRANPSSTGRAFLSPSRRPSRDRRCA